VAVAAAFAEALDNTGPAWRHDGLAMERSSPRASAMMPRLFAARCGHLATAYVRLGEGNHVATFLALVLDSGIVDRPARAQPPHLTSAGSSLRQQLSGGGHPLWADVRHIAAWPERGSPVSQKNQQVAGCGCLAIVILIIIGGIGNACSSSSTSTSQPVSPTSTAAVSSPSFGAAATPSPTHTRHHRAAATHPPVHARRPSPRHRRVPPSKAAPAPRSTCHPLTNSGKCYEPGEFCRNSDHGARGVAGNGEKIRCEDNNGWRWEPA
jgi:hypothetical protein